MGEPHFLDIERKKDVKRSTFLMVAIFVVTAIIGIGGAFQQFFIKYNFIQPTFNLEHLTLGKGIVQMGFILIPSLFGILAIFFSTRLMLLRSIKTLFGTSRNVFRKTGFILLIFGICFFIINFLPNYFQKNILFNTAISTPLIFLFPVILFVLIQVVFEELVFRSLLPQMLVGSGLTKLSAVIISSVVFGLMHYSNPEIKFYGEWILIIYILQGIFLGIITLLDNNLFIAIGYHFANNLLTLLFLNESVQVIHLPSFFSVKDGDIFTGFSILQILLTMCIIFICCAKKYKWKIKEINLR